MDFDRLEQCYNRNIFIKFMSWWVPLPPLCTPVAKGWGGGGVELICVIINFPGFWSYLNYVSASVDRVPKQGSIVQPTFCFLWVLYCKNKNWPWVLFDMSRPKVDTLVGQPITLVSYPWTLSFYLWFTTNKLWDFYMVNPMPSKSTFSISCVLWGEPGLV